MSAPNPPDGYLVRAESVEKSAGDYAPTARLERVPAVAFEFVSERRWRTLDERLTRIEEALRARA